MGEITKNRVAVISTCSVSNKKNYEICKESVTHTQGI